MIIDAGGKVVEILTTPASRTDLDAWITTYNLNVSTFMDAPNSMMTALTVATIRETVWIVELPTMKILYVNHGDVTGLSAPSVDAATSMILTLLK